MGGGKGSARAEAKVAKVGKVGRKERMGGKERRKGGREEGRKVGRKEGRKGGRKRERGPSDVLVFNSLMGFKGLAQAPSIEMDGSVQALFFYYCDELDRKGGVG